MSKGYNWQIYDAKKPGKPLWAIISGDEAKTLSGGEVQVHLFEMKTYRAGDTKEPQFIARAPECRVDTDSGVAHSEGHLEVFTPSTNFFIQGVGFLCTRSNSLLVISNQIETRIQKALLKSPSLATATNASSTNEVLKIFSDHFELRFNSNIVIYTGHVRALDPQMNLDCEKLTAKYATNGVIENILAEDNVVLTTTNHDRATSERATYAVTNGNELIELTGHPHWSDGQSELDGEIFLFNRGENTLRVEKNARLKMPHSSVMPSELFGTKTNAIPTNSVVEVSGNRFFVGFPSPFFPKQYFQAEQNVLVVSIADQVHATADEATFSNGSFNLTGNGVLTTEHFIASGHALLFNQTNTMLYVNDFASFKILPTKKSTLVSPVEIICDHYELKTNGGFFHGNPNGSRRFIEMNFLEDSIPGQLRCHDLKMNTISNQIESAVATGSVQLEEPQRNLTCKNLLLERSSATGLLRHLRAEDDVVLTEIPASAKTNQTPIKISGGLVDVHFSATTNQIEEMQAEKNVRIELNGDVAAGEHAFYKINGAREIFEVNGQPVATISKANQNGEIKSFQLRNAEKLFWEGPAGTLFKSPTNGVLRTSGGYKLVPLSKP